METVGMTEGEEVGEMDLVDARDRGDQRVDRGTPAELEQGAALRQVLGPGRGAIDSRQG